MAVSASPQENTPVTKLLCDVLSLFESYLLDGITHNFALNRLHSLGNLVEPFNVDAVFEHMDRLKDDFIDEMNK